MKRNTKKTDTIIISVLLIILALIIFGIIKGNMDGDRQKETVSAGIQVSDFNGKRIGILTGSSFEMNTLKRFPDSEYKYYNNYADLNTALVDAKIDGYVVDKPTVIYIHDSNPAISYLEESVSSEKYYFLFRKDDATIKNVCTQFNEFLTKLRADGTLKKLDDIWFGTDESLREPEELPLSGENGTFNVATYSGAPPFTYVKDGKVTGYTINLLNRFCREYGYRYELSDTDVSSVLAGLSSGIFDFAAAPVSYTEERGETMLYSEPIYSAEVVLAVRTSDIAANGMETAVTKATPLSYFAQKRIGILTGSAYEPAAKRVFPDAEYVYFDVAADMALATVDGMIDGYLMSEEQAAAMISESPALFCLDEIVEEVPYAFAFPKTSEGDALRAEINRFIAKISSDGTMDRLIDKWVHGSNEQEVDMSDLTGKNGELKIACDGTTPPWEYVYQGKLTGYEIELVTMFCREYGYVPKFDMMTFSAVIPAIASGKYDMASANITVTEERAESVYFSDRESGSDILFVTVNPKQSSYASVEERPFSYYAKSRKIGVLTGGLYELMIKERYPDADLYQYNSQADLGAALNAGKIDCFTVPKSTAEQFKSQYKGLTYLNEVFTKIPYGFAFQKSAEKEYLREQMNEFLNNIKNSGVYDEITEVWFGSDESKKVVDFEGLTGANGSIKMVTTATMEPFSYIKDGRNTGFEIDLVARFCREYGYSLEIDNAQFASLIPGLTSGNYDLAAGNIMITAERKESVNFSDVYYTADAVAVVRLDDKDPEEDTDFFKDIALSFEKNFIREDRWKMILEGIATTCAITVASVFMGSLLAFLICLFRHTGSRLANVISDIYVKLLQGTPMVVLLMILYYIVLGKSGLTATWVAIIGFSLNFGAYGSEIMRSGIESIDGGQREAALALGFSENQAFFRFIFPQAVIRFLPVYSQEIVSLLKNTSIVGYIAIQDLTKMSDIIRSRTYEAFFPLITTALIYFILAWIITVILKTILKKLNPRKNRGVQK